MDAKVSIKTKTKTFQNLNKNCPLASFFVQPLFSVLNFYIGRFHQKFDEMFLNYVIFSALFLVNSHNLFQKQLLNVFFGCKNRVCHHNFKLDAENNGWTKNEAKTFSRKSVISRKIHWLDNVRQSSS